MTIHLHITDGAGARELTLDQDSFWIGCPRSHCDVELEVPGHGRILEVRGSGSGGIQIRAEPGLPFPVRGVAGDVGTRFESLLDGDLLNIGPATLKLHVVPSLEGSRGEELDPGLLSDSAPGAPVGAWYQTFMELADTLEAITAPERMIQSAMEGILGSTGADRVYLEVESSEGGPPMIYHLAQGGHRTPFRVSSSLVEQVKETGRVVHVPLAKADPIASRLMSVRREGISSTIALPLRALGKTRGVLYADCVREGAVLAAADLQRVAFISRLLASALGNRALVSNLVRAEAARGVAPHPALQTQSPACAAMVERVKLYAPTDYTVLIRGETGTGKEVVARALHELSRRSKGSFVPVNCAAIPEPLMESMLFGHEKGSFTGATQARRGHFEDAHGGSLFLDEIGDMAHDLQAKILRVLQDRIVMPVGSRRMVKVDVRILAATHQDLEQMVQEGRFREDLYYRLRELEILLPPLRERLEDLLALSQRFLDEAAAELGHSRVPDLSPETIAHLRQAPWRGNIRELRHVIKGAALRAGGGTIGVHHLDAAPRLAAVATLDDATAPGRTWKEKLETQELLALRTTLDQAGGNLTKGAELFGVPRTTYREKLVKHGLLKERG